MFGYSTYNSRCVPTERELMFTLLLEMKTMAVDLAKLQTASARLVTAVDALIAAHGDPASQAAVDAVADAMDAESVKAEAAVAPPPAA